MRVPLTFPAKFARAFRFHVFSLVVFNVRVLSLSELSSVYSFARPFIGIFMVARPAGRKHPYERFIPCTGYRVCRCLLIVFFFLATKLFHFVFRLHAMLVPNWIAAHKIKHRKNNTANDVEGKGKESAYLPVVFPAVIKITADHRLHQFAILVQSRCHEPYVPAIGPFGCSDICHAKPTQKLVLSFCLSMVI